MAPMGLCLCSLSELEPVRCFRAPCARLSHQNRQPARFCDMLSGKHVQWLQIQSSLCFGSKGDGFVFKPQDVLNAPRWRLGVEDSIVHVSTDTGLVRSSESRKRPPAALLVGNARVPTGSITHVCPPSHPGNGPSRLLRCLKGSTCPTCTKNDLSL